MKKTTAKTRTEKPTTKISMKIASISIELEGAGSRKQLRGLMENVLKLVGVVVPPDQPAITDERTKG